MVRTTRSARVLTLFVVTWLAGCQSAEKAALQPLPPDAPPLTYGELMQRGKNQLNAAHEFYYSDQWKQVEQAGVALRETGTQLTRLQQVGWTDKQKAQFASLTKEFVDASDSLKSAGTAQDATKTSQVFQRLNEVYRQLKIEQMTVAPASPAAPPAGTPPAVPPK